jgi:hypothetical protein
LGNIDVNRPPLPAITPNVLSRPVSVTSANVGEDVGPKGWGRAMAVTGWLNTDMIEVYFSGRLIFVIVILMEEEVRHYQP